MQELMLALMVWLSPQTGLPVPDEMPRVVMADPCDIHRLGMNDGTADCDADIRAIAAYVGSTIYLPDTWSAGSLYDVSALLHELVHHMQAENGLTPATAQCFPREGEKPAYDAQIAFLEAAGVDAMKVMGINGLSLHYFTECEMGY